MSGQNDIEPHRLEDQQRNPKRPPEHADESSKRDPSPQQIARMTASTAKIGSRIDRQASMCQNTFCLRNSELGRIDSPKGWGLR
jgi:hypothetical protein